MLELPFAEPPEERDTMDWDAVFSNAAVSDRDTGDAHRDQGQQVSE